MSLALGYFADGPWSHLALARMLSDPTIQVAFICARFDRPDCVLREQAARHRVDFLVHPKINSTEFLQTVGSYGCDLFVSMSFNQIFRDPLLSLPRLGTINCHAGRLPFYRGRNVLNWALINDESEFGITVHYVDAGIDTGDIIAQRVLPITDSDTYSTLLDRSHTGCAELLYETVKELQTGTATRTVQTDIHPEGFYCTQRREGDEKLSWDQSSRDVFSFVRAICRPGPEARTLLGTAELKINRVEWLAQAPAFKGIPGAVLRVDQDGFLVKTTDSFVKVVEFTGVDRVRVGDRLT